MPVQHVHHTKVVKVPEYHHYFHDRKQSHQKRYPYHSHNDFEAYNDKDPALYDELNYFPNMAYNDFETYPEGHTNAFHDRQHTPSLPPQQFLKSLKNGSHKRHVQHFNSNNSNRRRNPYEPQHYYHRY